MNLDQLRKDTKHADGKSELVIVSSDSGNVYELVSVSICENDLVVMLHAKLVRSPPGITNRFEASQQ